MKKQNSLLRSLNKKYIKSKNLMISSLWSLFFKKIKKYKYNSPLTPVKHFNITQDSSIPKLSWLCEIENNIYNVTVGKGVEYGDNFIVEGVWDEEFCDLKFHTSDHFYGSGIFVDSNNIAYFVPPRQLTDFLYVLYDKRSKKSYISNSFNFIFRRINIDIKGEFFLNFKNSLHDSSNRESKMGADSGDPLIAEDNEYVMYRMMYHNFTIDDKGRINYCMQSTHRMEANTFEDYKNFLLETTKKIIKNAESKDRRHSLGSITMCSTGYDSSAVSAICASSGVKDAITLDVVTAGHNDCGDKIAELLGLNCIKVQGYLGKNVGNLSLKLAIEANEEVLEFFATPGLGDNIVFYPMEEYLTDKIVFSGLYGDGFWSKKGGENSLVHNIPYMKSRNEFRLRTGYYIIPTPAFGAFFTDKLYKIVNDRSMLPYTLHTSYDRPIPRRICEEAGIPRDWFGQEKAANNPHVINHMEFFDIAVQHVMNRYK